MKHPHRPLLTAVVALLIAAPASAQNLNFLKNSALSAMSKEDKEIATASFRDALNQAADGETREWQNDKTGASGALTLVRSYHDALTNLDCRQVTMELRASGRDDKGPYYMCKAPDGKWKFSRPPGASGK